MSDEFTFAGFIEPVENWSKLPHALINMLPRFTSEAELKIVLYVLRHTWGFGEFGDIDAKCITTDEFLHGRKRQDGTRLDGGIGMSKPSLYRGLDNAVDHGFITRLVDNIDLGRVTHYYRLCVSGSIQGTVYAVDPEMENPVAPWHTIDPQIKQAVYARSQGRCAYCDRKSTRWHYDHIQPKSRGGTDEENNLALACPQCNLNKHDKNPDEWGHQAFFYENDVKKLYRGWSINITPPSKETLPRSKKETSDRKSRNNSVDAVKPHNKSRKNKAYSQWKREDVLAYYAEYPTALDKLVEAWGYQTRFCDLTIDEAVTFAKTYHGLTDCSFSDDNYTSLASYTRAKAGWKKDLKPTEMLLWVTAWRESRLTDTAKDSQTLAAPEDNDWHVVELDDPLIPAQKASEEDIPFS